MFDVVSSVDRYQAARDHFNSAGFGLTKTLFVLGIIAIIGVVAYFSLKK